MKRKKALVDTFMIGTAIATILACVGLVIFIFMQIAR
jgi:hypothetical protein